MPNINDTEAIIEKGILGKLTCKISLLAGTIGDSFIKLYNTQHPSFNQNFYNCPYLGLAFETTDKYFSICVCSTDKSFPLYKGDSLRVRFEDGKFMNLVFRIGGHQLGREKRNFIAILSDIEILQFMESYLLDIEVLNHKTGERAIYEFSNHPMNYQYSEIVDGKKLLQIMIEKLFDASKRMLK